MLTDKQQQKIINIAEQARLWAERLVVSKNQDIPKHTSQHTLEGLCAIASHELQTMLYRAGIPADLAIAPNHAFVLVDNDQLAIDITATQFGSRYPEIFLEKTKVIEKDSTWNFKKKLSTHRDAFWNWPKDQVPFALRQK